MSFVTCFFRSVKDDDILNKSLVYQTILGDQICVTYDPPAESDVTQGVQPVSTQQTCLLLSNPMHYYCTSLLQLRMYINSTEVVDLHIHFHEKTYTTFDRGGKLRGPQYTGWTEDHRNFDIPCNFLIC